MQVAYVLRIQAIELKAESSLTTVPSVLLHEVLGFEARETQIP